MDPWNPERRGSSDHEFSKSDTRISEARRRGRGLRLSGRERHPALRRPLRLRPRSHPYPPRAGGRPRGRRLRAGLGQGGGVHRHVRSRRHQPHHGHRERLSGQRADGGHHGSGAHEPHRHRRLPGSRRHRHHAAHRQAQLPGEASGRPSVGHPRGLLHREDGPSGPGGRGHSGGSHHHGLRLRPRGRPKDRPARLQAHRERPSQADQGRGAGHRRSATPGDLCRRRRHLGQRRRRAA